MTPPYHRDLIGYGAHAPHPRWPGDARIAVNFVMNYEEGSEYSFENGDGRSEASLTENPASPVPSGERDLTAEGMFEYGTRVGFWRVMRLFSERSLPLTVFACAQALERHPARGPPPSARPGTTSAATAGDGSNTTGWTAPPSRTTSPAPSRA